MSSLLEVHEEAMSFVDMAIRARLEGRKDDAAQWFIKAFERERSAALTLKDRDDAEPTRSILLRSAATLALDCGELREAERLSAIALAGNPPEAIAQELRDVLDRASFGRHLQVKGIVLDEGELQLTLHGNAVAPGLAPSNAAFTRIQATERVFQRTAERKTGRPYNTHLSKQIKREYETYVSVPRAASFAVSFRFGSGQQSILSHLRPAALLAELLECLNHFNRGDSEALRRIIGDERYYLNFMGLASQLAPDGEDVKMVGMTARIEGKERSVSLDKRSAVSWYREDSGPQRRRVIIEGFLWEARKRPGKSRKSRGAKNLGKESFITITDDAGHDYKVTVPSELIADIVKPLWDREVVVTGMQDGKEIILEDIRAK